MQTHFSIKDPVETPGNYNTEQRETITRVSFDLSGKNRQIGQEKEDKW